MPSKTNNTAQDPRARERRASEERLSKMRDDQGSMRLDPRPADTSYVHSCVQYAIDRLCAAGHLDGVAKRPTAVKINELVESALKSLKIQRNHHTSLEEDFSSILRQLLYPFHVNTSSRLQQLSNTGKQSETLALLWLVQLSEYAANVAERERSKDPGTFFYQCATSYQSFLRGIDFECFITTDNSLSDRRGRSSTNSHARSELVKVNAELRNAAADSTSWKSKYEHYIFKAKALRNMISFLVKQIQETSNELRDIEESCNSCKIIIKSETNNSRRATSQLESKLQTSPPQSISHIAIPQDALQAPPTNSHGFNQNAVVGNASEELRLEVSKKIQILTKLSAKHAVWSTRLSLPAPVTMHVRPTSVAGAARTSDFVSFRSSDNFFDDNETLVKIVTLSAAQNVCSNESNISRKTQAGLTEVEGARLHVVSTLQKRLDKCVALQNELSELEYAYRTKREAFDSSLHELKYKLHDFEKQIPQQNLYNTQNDMHKVKVNLTESKRQLAAERQDLQQYVFYGLDALMNHKQQIQTLLTTV